jgi:short-subunit dehydrogenase
MLMQQNKITPKFHLLPILLGSTAGFAIGAGLKWLLTEPHKYPNLQGKYILIAGGSRGLGLTLAREYGRQGARIAICARDQQEIQAASEQLRELNIDVFPLSCDLTDERQVQSMVEQITAHFGQIDILVNVAGVINVGPFATQTVKDFEQVMAINYWGPVFTTNAVLPQMISRHAGQLVNISSIGGKISVPHLLPYSSAKSALTAYSEGLNAELAKEGITVTTIIPGLMRTGSYRNITVKGQHAAEYALFSVLDSLPFISIDAQRAAQQIVRATQRGDAEFIITIPARLTARAAALFPNITAAIMQAIARTLPEPGIEGNEARIGSENETPITQSILTAQNQQAAQMNNEESFSIPKAKGDRHARQRTKRSSSSLNNRRQ